MLEDENESIKEEELEDLESKTIEELEELEEGYSLKINNLDEEIKEKNSELEQKERQEIISRINKSRETIQDLRYYGYYYSLREFDYKFDTFSIQELLLLEQKMEILSRIGKNLQIMRKYDIEYSIKGLGAYYAISVEKLQSWDEKISEKTRESITIIVKERIKTLQQKEKEIDELNKKLNTKKDDNQQYKDNQIDDETQIEDN